MCHLRRTLLFAAGLLFSTAPWANCVKVTDNSFLSEAAIKAGYTRATGAAPMMTISVILVCRQSLALAPITSSSLQVLCLPAQWLISLPPAFRHPTRQNRCFTAVI